MVRHSDFRSPIPALVPKPKFITPGKESVKAVKAQIEVEFCIHIFSKMRVFIFLSCFILAVLVHKAYGAEKTEEEPLQEPQVAEKSDASSANGASQSTESESPTNTASESTEEDDKKYALGSLCNYCSYCKVGICQKVLKCSSVVKERKIC